MDLLQLREQTRPEHEATEAAVSLTAPGLTRHDYVVVLRQFLPLLLAWEPWAAHAAPTDLRPLLAARQRSAMLRADLQFFGDTTPILPSAPFTRALDDLLAGIPADSPLYRARFLGALYVIEGSSLGGQFIARHVEDTLGLEPGHGNAYFRGYAEQTGARWREVRTELAAVDDALAPDLIQAARTTFLAFGDDLRHSVPH